MVPEKLPCRLEHYHLCKSVIIGMEITNFQVFQAELQIQLIGALSSIPEKYKVE